LAEVSNNANLGAAEIALRLLIYEDENGNFPSALDELGEDVPYDPFTGESFIYRYEEGGFIVYSVGENLVDDGGKAKSSKRDPKTKDTVFRYGTFFRDSAVEE